MSKITRRGREKTWKHLLKAFNGQCIYCGEYYNYMTEDHLVPKSLGGSNSIYNILPACEKCNSLKSNSSFLEFALYYCNPMQVLKRWRNALIFFARSHKQKIKKISKDREERHLFMLKEQKKYFDQLQNAIAS